MEVWEVVHLERAGERHLLPHTWPVHPFHLDAHLVLYRILLQETGKHKLFF